MSDRCTYMIKPGKRCKNWAVRGSTVCNNHGGRPKPQGRAEPCSYTFEDGEPCRNRAVRGSDPPLCASHHGLATGPRGRANGQWKHGFYEEGDKVSSADGMIEDLLRKQDQLAELLERVVELGELMGYMTMHVGNASKIMRMLLDQQTLEGEGDDLLAKLGPALDLVREKLQIQGS